MTDIVFDCATGEVTAGPMPDAVRQALATAQAAQEAVAGDDLAERLAAVEKVLTDRGEDITAARLSLTADAPTRTGR